MQNVKDAPLRVSSKKERERGERKNWTGTDKVKENRRSTTDEEEVKKVSRRVPTAVPLLLMMSTVKRKKGNTRQTQNKKQLE